MSLQGIRIAPLKGVVNFRDLGGYSAADGRTVRWKRLYRSAALHEMTAADREFLVSLGIRHVYDLRSLRERTSDATPASELPNVLYRAADHDEEPGDIPRLMRTTRLDREKSRQVMLDVYRQLPLTFRGAYGALFEHVLTDELPLVFHCAVGKDRTGVAAALLLSALGVGRDQVLEDYLLTDQFFERSCTSFLRGHFGKLFAQTERPVWEPFLRADADYLRAMFDHLDSLYGGVEGYLEKELGLSTASLAMMRDRLLE